jgi:hypothetical protein
MLRCSWRQFSGRDDLKNTIAALLGRCAGL